ncbi:hypothetical protein ACFL0X_01015 [Nanoarchaeota archaeon]
MGRVSDFIRQKIDSYFPSPIKCYFGYLSREGGAILERSEREFLERNTERSLEGFVGSYVSFGNRGKGG